MNSNSVILVTAILNGALLSDDGGAYIYDTGDEVVKENVFLTDEDGNKITDENSNYIMV